MEDVPADPPVPSLAAGSDPPVAAADDQAAESTEPTDLAIQDKESVSSEEGVLPRTDQTLILNWLERRSTAKRATEDERQLAIKSRRMWKEAL
eukprot:6075412-Amphidinium_carterae.1